MILKSYLVEKNITLLDKYFITLIYGENIGMKDDIKNEIRKFFNNYERLIWLNPVPEDHWDYSASIDLSRSLIEDQMFPLTLKGLEDGMSFLTK